MAAVCTRGAGSSIAYSITTVTTDSEAPCTATITTTTRGVDTTIDRITTVASGSAIPTRVAPAATVEPIATAAGELAGVAAVAWFCAGTCRDVKAESVAGQ
jgi:hypothetical protein